VYYGIAKTKTLASLSSVSKLPQVQALLKYITFPFLLFNIIFSIRVGFDYIGILTILGNPITAILGFEQTPLIQFIKHLF